jgi:hypothetical protein
MAYLKLKKTRAEELIHGWDGFLSNEHMTPKIQQQNLTIGLLILRLAMIAKTQKVIISGPQTLKEPINALAETCFCSICGCKNHSNYSQLR